MLCVLCSSPTDDTDLHGGYAGCYLFEHGTHGINRSHAVRLYLTTNLTNPTNLFSGHGLNGLYGAKWDALIEKNIKNTRCGSLRTDVLRALHLCPCL